MICGHCNNTSDKQEIIQVVLIYKTGIRIDLKCIIVSGNQLELKSDEHQASTKTTKPTLTLQNIQKDHNTDWKFLWTRYETILSIHHRSHRTFHRRIRPTIASAINPDSFHALCGWTSLRRHVLSACVSDTCHRYCTLKEKSLDLARIRNVS